MEFAETLFRIGLHVAQKRILQQWSATIEGQYPFDWIKQHLKTLATCISVGASHFLHYCLFYIRHYCSFTSDTWVLSAVECDVSIILIFSFNCRRKVFAKQTSCRRDISYLWWRGRKFIERRRNRDWRVNARFVSGFFLWFLKQMAIFELQSIGCLSASLWHKCIFKWNVWHYRETSSKEVFIVLKSTLPADTCLCLLIKSGRSNRDEILMINSSKEGVESDFDSLSVS